MPLTAVAIKNAKPKNKAYGLFEGADVVPIKQGKAKRAKQKGADED